MGMARSLKGDFRGMFATVGPFRAAPQTLPVGPSLATELPYHRPFGIDWITAQATGTMAALYIGIFGEKGKGKSLAAKVIVFLMLILQAFDRDGRLTRMRVHVHNRKSDQKSLDGEAGAEWAALIKNLGATRVRLEDMRFGLFDPGLPYAENTLRAIDYFSYIMKRSLEPYHMVALNLVVKKMQQGGTPFTDENLLQAFNSATFEDIAELHATRMSPELRAELAQRKAEDERLRAESEKFAYDRTPRATGSVEALYARLAVTRPMRKMLKKGLTELSLALMSVVEGALGQVFTGQDSYANMLRAPALIIDYGELSKRAVGLLELMRHHTTSYGLRTGDISVIPSISIEEEFHTALVDNGEPNLVLMQKMAEDAAISRSSHEMRLYISQEPSKFFVGDEGSHARLLSNQFFNGFDAFFYGGLSKSKGNEELLKRSHVKRKDAATLMGDNLPVGRMLLQVKGQGRGLGRHWLDIRATVQFIEANGRTRSAGENQVVHRRHIEDWDIYPMSTSLEETEEA